MTETVATATPERKKPPVVRDITIADIGDALAAGIRDFRDAPMFGLFFGGIYTLAGWLLIALLFAFSVPIFAFPAATGFALIAPFVAAGTYEVSRRLELGEPLSWSQVLGSVRRRGGKELGWMALVTLFAFYIWIDAAGIIYLVFFGLREMELERFIDSVFGTVDGFYFLALGNLAGAVLAITVFSVTLVSFPILLDRDIDFVTAMVTSVKAVFRNPGPLLVWCFTIIVLLALSIMTAFLGLLVVLPILGHTTWHLYRKLVEPEATAEPAPSEAAPAGLP